MHGKIQHVTCNSQQNHSDELFFHLIWIAEVWRIEAQFKVDIFRTVVPNNFPP